MKGFMIAGTASGVGKTSVNLAIEAALRARHLVVQSFKCGPDYLDTTHHSQICGRPCRNLDTWMCDADETRASFWHGSKQADVVVVEGMMGLFDGVDGRSEAGSSAEIAKLLGLPVVLIVDASMSSRSVAATVHGFATFDVHLRVAGVIFNRVVGQRHFELLRDSVEANTAVQVLGWLPCDNAMSVPERHLGLVSAVEHAWSPDRVGEIAAIAERFINIDRLLEIAQSMSGQVLPKPTLVHTPASPRVRIGVAMDEAFCFYYQENFDLLREFGAEIVAFSPLRDECLPRDLDALYIGGGYPELHAAELSRNHRMMREIREFAESWRPVYAECGGLMYLGREIRSDAGTYEMTGILPLVVEQSPRLVDFGYADVEFQSDCLLGPKGTHVRGHSFHYSRCSSVSEIEKRYRVSYALSGKSEREGYAVKNVLASYLHLHFRANKVLARSFVEAACSARSKVGCSA